MEFVPAIILLVAIISLGFNFYQHKEKKKKEATERQEAINEKKRDLEKAKEALKESIAQHEENIQTYLTQIYTDFATLNILGLGDLLEKPPLLENVYVKLRAKTERWKAGYQWSIRESDEIEAKFFKSDEYEKEKDFIAVFTETHAQQQEDIQKAKEEKKEAPPSLRLLILGKPGSGKTTLMKWIALQCGRTAPFANFIPVFIALKDVVSHFNTNFKGKNILKIAAYFIENKTIDSTFLEQKFKENKLLFILDGLDEVADEQIRQEMIAWIEAQHIAQNSMIITSRFSGLSTKIHFTKDLPTFCIQDFDIQDIDYFLKNWCINIESALRKDYETVSTAEERGLKEHEELMKVLKSKEYEGLQRIAMNPLLLTIIAIVHRSKAKLPKERHTLYRQALEVLIDLRNRHNKRIAVYFSVDNSLANLAKIAVFLMQNNRRELSLEELQNILPATIEGKTQIEFLKEMVLKAGLLFYSDAQYGFLHKTFQEYLAAYYYQEKENPNAILEHWQKDYWEETFKLFVNIGNARAFFAEVIRDLNSEKSYWKKINLWEAIIGEIVNEDAKKHIEKQLAQQILNILQELPYDAKYEFLITQLHTYYALYKEYAILWEEQAWQLFHTAPHPFVQSIGTSILFKIKGNGQQRLLYELKKRLADFAQKDNATSTECLHFLMQNNNNTLFLHLAIEKNILHFAFALQQLQNNNLFSILLYLRDFRDFRDFRELLELLELLELQKLVTLRDAQDALDLRKLRDLLDLRKLRDSRDSRDSRDLLYLRELRKLRKLRDSQDPLDPLDAQDALDLRKLRDSQDPQDALYARELRKLRDSRDSRDVRYSRGSRGSREFASRYEQEYQPFLERKQKNIATWSHKALQILQGLSDKELLKYFPDTSPAHLQRFRAGDYAYIEEV